MTAKASVEAIERSHSVLHIHRRSTLERRVILMLRGREAGAVLSSDGYFDRKVSDGPGSVGNSQLLEILGLSFACLHDVAVSRGLQIKPPETPYLSIDELRLLILMSKSQRARQFVFELVEDSKLAGSVACCGMALLGLGMRLQAMSLASPLAIEKISLQDGE